MKKILWAIIAVIILGGGIWLVQNTKNNINQTNQESMNQFRFSMVTWVGYGPVWLAQDKGFFKEEGLDVDITLMEDPATRKAAMMSRSIDGMANTVDLLILDREQNVPSVAVSLFDFSNGGDGVIAKNDIKSVQDLKGKTILLQKNFVSESLFNYILIKNNIGLHEVTTIDTEAGAAGAAFAAGKSDVSVTWEPWLSKASETGNGHVLVSSADYPGVIVDILTVHEDYLREHPEAIKQFMRAWFKAVRYWQENPEEANTLMAKHYDMAPDEFADVISGLEWPSYTESVEYFGKPQTGKIYDVAKTFSDIFIQLGEIKKSPKLDQAINATLLNSLYEKRK